MQLSNPLETVMRPAHADLVLALHRSGGRLSGRRIAAVVGSASPSRTLEHLRSLVASGLVVAERSTTATHYSVNEQHLLWPAIETIIESRVEFRRRLARIAQDLPTGSAVALYGSTAAHRSTAESDVDLLVVYPDGVPLEERDRSSGHLAAQVTTLTGNRAEIFDLTRAQLAGLVAAGDPMVGSWRRNLECVVGDVEAMLREVA